MRVSSVASLAKEETSPQKCGSLAVTRHIAVTDSNPKKVISGRNRARGGPALPCHPRIELLLSTCAKGSQMQPQCPQCILFLLKFHHPHVLSGIHGILQKDSGESGPTPLQTGPAPLHHPSPTRRNATAAACIGEPGMGPRAGRAWNKTWDVCLKLHMPAEDMNHSGFAVPRS